MGVSLAYLIGILFILIPMPTLTENCEEAYNHEAYYVSQCNTLHLEGWIETILPSAFSVGLIVYGIKEMENFNFLLGSGLLYGFILSTFGLYLILLLPKLDCVVPECHSAITSAIVILGVIGIPCFLIGWTKNGMKLVNALENQ